MAPTSSTTTSVTSTLYWSWLAQTHMWQGSLWWPTVAWFRWAPLSFLSVLTLSSCFLSRPARQRGGARPCPHVLPISLRSSCCLSPASSCTWDLPPLSLRTGEWLYFTPSSHPSWTLWPTPWETWRWKMPWRDCGSRGCWAEIGETLIGSSVVLEQPQLYQFPKMVAENSQ